MNNTSEHAGSNGSTVTLCAQPDCDVRSFIEILDGLHIEYELCYPVSGTDLKAIVEEFETSVILLVQTEPDFLEEALAGQTRHSAPPPILFVRDSWSNVLMGRMYALGVWDCLTPDDAVRTRFALRNAVACQKTRNRFSALSLSGSRAVIPQHDPNPVLQVAMDGDVIYANPSSMVLLDCWGVSNGRIPDEWLQLVRSSHEKAGHSVMDVYCSDRVFQLSILPLSQPASALIFAHDISDRMQAEKLLKESENLFRLAFRTSPDAVNINRLSDGMYVDVNEGFSKITGYTREEVIGRTSADINIWYNPADRLRLVTQLQQFGFTSNMETRFRMKSGAVVEALISASVIFINSIPHILSITRDISELKKIADQLRLSEQRYRGIFENTGTATVLFGDNGRIIMCNQNFAVLAGCPKDEIIDRRQWQEFVHPEDLPRMLEYNAVRTTSTSLPRRYEFRFRTVGNEDRDILLQIGVIPGTEFRVASLLDISEIKRTEQSLRESEERLRSLQENLSIGMFRSTPDGRYLYVNPALVSIFGFRSADELYRHSVVDLYVEPDERTIILDQLRKGVVIIEHEIRFVHRSGKQLWCRLSARGSYDGTGALQYIDGVVVDISESRALEEERRKLHHAIRQSPSSIAITDPDGRIEFVNPAFLEMTGGNPEQIYGTLLDLLQRSPDSASLHDEIWSAIREGREWRGEIRKLRTNGETYWESCKIKGVWGPGGEFTDIIAVSDDVTERKRIESDLIIAKEKAEEMSRIKSTFLATMSHELRTPLNGILGFANLLEEDLSDPSLKDMASIIVNSGNRLLDTLNSILDLSVVEADKLNVNWEEVHIINIVQDVQCLYDVNASQKGLTLSVLLPDEDIVITSDTRLVRQILNNIVNNAIKYTQKGSVTITVKRVPHKGQPHVAVHVEDSGIGIKEENQALVFEEFRQVSEGYGRAYEGSGLGLSVSTKFAKLLDGAITLDSRPGHGSCFTLFLPERRTIGSTET